MLATLIGLKTYFSSRGFDCDLLSKGSELEKEQLFVALGPDEKGRDLILSIRSAELPLNQEMLQREGEPQEEPKNFHLLQFACCFPFRVEEKAFGEMARMLFLLNQGLELPGFELSEREKIVYYRYALPVVNKHIEEALLVCLFGTIDYLIKSFLPKLESIAIGAKSAQELIDEANQSLYTDRDSNIGKSPASKPRD
jgi:hypothetical protein